MPSASFYSMTEDEYSDLARAIIDKLNLTSVDQITKLKGSSFASSIRSFNTTMDSAFTQDGTLYFNSNIPDYACYQNKKVRKVVIGENVTYIGKAAFSGCTNLREVEFNAINCSVFAVHNTGTVSEAIFSYDCPISSIIFGEHVESIPNDLFNVPGTNNFRTTTIENITIPASCTRIGDYAFKCCKGIKSFTLHDGITYIGSYAFQYCTGLTSFYIPTGVTRIYARTFDNCSNLASITFHDGITRIDEGACNYVAIRSFTTPPNLTYFGDRVFAYSQLEELYLTAPGITGSSISYWLAYHYNLHKIVFGESFGSLPSYCFYNDNALQELILLKASSIVTASNSYTFNNCNIGAAGVAIYVPNALIETYRTTNYWASGNIPQNLIAYQTSMTINSVSYNCNYGDSWSTFIASADNIDGFVISGNNILNAAKTKYVSINSKAVKPTDLILGLSYDLVDI